MADSIVPDLTLKDPVIGTDIIYITDAVNDFKTTLAKILAYIQANLTNNITANVIPKSDGTKLTASHFVDTGSAITISYATGTFTIKGTGLIKIGDTTNQGNSSVLTIDDDNGLLSSTMPLKVSNDNIIKDRNGTRLLTTQQNAIADASIVLSSVVTQFNTLLAELRTHGLIAT